MVDTILEIRDNAPAFSYFKEAIKILPYSNFLEINTKYPYVKKALSLNELIKNFYYDIHTEINPHGTYSRNFGYDGPNKKTLRINIKGNGISEKENPKNLLKKTEILSNNSPAIFTIKSKIISNRALNFERSLFFYKKNKDLLGPIEKYNSSLISTRFYPDKQRNLYHPSLCFIFENFQPAEESSSIFENLFTSLNLKEFSEIEKKSDCNYKAFREIYALDVLNRTRYFDEFASTKFKKELNKNKQNILTLINGSIENRDLTDFVLNRGISPEHKNIYLGIVFKRAKPALKRLLKPSERKNLENIVKEYNNLGEINGWSRLTPEKFEKKIKEL